MAHDDHDKPEEPKTLEEQGREDSTYIPAVAKGLANTLKHVVKKEYNTQFYPEERRDPPYPGYRGEHRLIRDEQGRERCTACMLCATVCPSHCIEIVGEEAPWPDREKRPKIFNIDMMRCIYCGMCEWACPCRAIELTPVYNVVSRTREEKIYTKEHLLKM